MTRTKRALLTGISVPALLSACFGDGDSDSPTPVTPPPTSGIPLQERFGAAFLSIFNTDANAAEATEPAAASVPPIDLNNEAFTG